VTSLTPGKALTRSASVRPSSFHGEAAIVEVRWKDLGLTGAPAVRDLWSKRGLGRVAEGWGTVVPRHGAIPLALVALGLGATAAHAATHSVTEFGAAGDGHTVNTSAIQRTIDRCAEQGGGSVLVPAGVFVSGALRLRSNVDLHLESGGVLKGSDALADYELDGRRLGLLLTQDAVNVSITGHGTIDGNGDHFLELGRAKRIESAALAYTRQKERFRALASGLGDGPVVPKDRPFQLIIFSDCCDVTIRDVLVTNSPFWTVHLADCDGVVVSGIRIWCNLLVPNSDGLDVTSSRNVLVSDGGIPTGDDAIAVARFEDLTVSGFRGTAAPSTRGTAAITLRSGRGLRLSQVDGISISKNDVK
jgi:hypothetical protein